MAVRYFENREQAGQLLAAKLQAYANRPAAVVLALPRGGVPVAYQVALALNLPLDIMVVRKLGLPGEEELAMGAIASGGLRVFNPDVMEEMHPSPQTIETVVQFEQQELNRRERLYRDDRPALPLKDKLVIVVDDGLATGTTMEAALAALKKQEVARIVIAVPIAPYTTFREFQLLVDQVVCLITPVNFFALGAWYRDFSQTSDTEVCRLLEQAATRPCQVAG